MVCANVSWSRFFGAFTRSTEGAAVLTQAEADEVEVLVSALSKLFNHLFSYSAPLPVARDFYWHQTPFSASNRRSVRT